MTTTTADRPEDAARAENDSAAPRRKADVAGIYPLTPQQQGLLVHARGHAAGDTDPYFSQDVLVLEGQIDLPAFQAAWADVVARHAILRTDFRWEDVPQPVQIVFRQRPAALSIADWRAQAPTAADIDAALARHVAALRARGFDFARAADPQMTLARVADERWLLVWAYHHIAIDGWSYALVLRDLLACYHARRTGAAPALPPARPFSDYLAWLARQDAAAAEHFWRDELAGFDGLTPLPLPRPLQPPPSRWGELSVPLLAAPQLAALVQRERITLSTLCQGLWALLLGRLAPARQVTFGVTVAGRPADLPGSDDIAGLFINTLPFSVALHGAQRVGDWLRGIQAQNARLRQFEHVSLARIQAVSSGGGRSLFDSLLVVENFPVDAALTAQDGPLRASLHLPQAADGEVLATRGRNNYPLTLVFVPGAVPRLVFAFDRQRFDDAGVQALAAQARALLDTLLSQCDRLLDDIALATPPQAAALAAQGQGRWGDAGQPAYCSLPQQVSQWAQRRPEALAVCAADGEWTYAELDARATRLARCLRARGVGESSRVAIVAERSAAFVAGLLAVMKAGAAYLPLEPGLPPARLWQLLDDAAVSLLLAPQGPVLAAAVAAGRAALELTLDLADLPEPPPGVELPAQLAPLSAAYVIYTSGSTGSPKGVVLTHGGLAQYVAGLHARLQMPPGARHAMVSTVGADLGHTTLFGALASGGTLCLLPTQLAFDPDGFAQWMHAQRIDVLKIVPSHLGGLMAAQAPVLPRLALVLGGEAAAPALLARLRQLAPGLRLLNHYGPTETTVGVLVDEEDEEMQADGDDGSGGPAVAAGQPLGRPLPGCWLQVLDAALQPVPTGVPGELYIGGESLARGYLGRPDLTAERFVPDPARRGQRMYRSGDRVAWQRDGRLQFLGRIDDQVKIRGHRVEPRELAAALRTLPGVHDAAVVVRPADSGGHRLLGYVTPASLQTHVLREALAGMLPEQLLPAALLALPALPLTPNGKLDRRALPEPEAHAPHAGAADIDAAPRTPNEAVLAEIWAAVLQRPSVGIHDNFFDLGGDSILNLQVIARARRAGLRLTPRQVFEQQTVAKLAAVATSLVAAPTAAVRPAAADAAHADAQGDAPLTPIQHWFFDSAQPEPQHWNQAVVLQVRRRLDAAVLAAALQQLVARHEALRLRFAHTPSGWRQRVAAHDTTQALLDTADLRAMDSVAARAEIERLGLRLQQRLSYTDGPLLRAALVDLGPERHGRLLLVAHHLAIDSVSWRLLIGELQTVYDALLAGQVPKLPPTGTGYLAWARRLSAQAEQMSGELVHWQAAVGHAAPASDHAASQPDLHYAAARQHRMALSASATSSLLVRAPAMLGCRSEELLLTALALSLCRCLETSSVAIELESHGRDATFADDAGQGNGVDVSTTVGWFTCRYPVHLSPKAGHAVDTLQSVAAQLRSVPAKGLGYGLLRYLSPDAAVRRALAGQRAPDVTFNYLGQLDAGLADGWLQPVDESMGATRSPRNLRTHALDVDAHVAGGRLHVAWTWAPGAWNEASIQALADSFAAQLETLLSIDAPASAQPVAPSQPASVKWPLAKLSDAQQRSLLARWPTLQDAYPLAPLQAGILFHSLDARACEALYINQLHCEIRSPLQPAHLEQAWREAVARHAILRTVFAWDGLDEPHQVVLGHAELPLQRSVLQAGQTLAGFLAEDMARGFALDQAPLMRVSLVEHRGTLHLAWTRHHLLLDGWSSARLLMEVFSRYDAAVRGAAPAQAMPAPPPYREHIAWLQRRDAAADNAWWQAQLAGIDEPTLLQSHAGLAPGQAAQGGMGRHVRRLDAGMGTALAARARRHRVTLNTLVQAAWAQVLSRHAGRRDVVFGITVAGRPAELEGADAMLGLFINTLPLRVRLPATQSVADWWQAIQRHNLELREHEQAQLAQLQVWAGMPAGTPLFDTLLVFENYPVDRAGLQSLSGSLDIAAVEATETLSLPLTLIAYPGVEGAGTEGAAMSFEFAFRRNAFEEEAVAQLARHLTDTLEAFTRQADDPLAALALKCEDESGSEPASPDAASVAGTLVTRFEARVRQAPQAVALRFEGRELRYGELNRRANRLASVLMARGVGPEVPVALCLERSPMLLVAILAVLKAGGFYVPLDPASPAERLRATVADSGARCLLHDGTAACWSGGLDAIALGLDDIEGPAGDAPTSDDDNPAPRASAHHLAYVIYTSGSTGKPKGVPVTHANVLRLFDTSQPLFGFGPCDVWTLFHSCAFDFSVWELWGAWLHGGRLVVVPQAVARDASAFFDLLCRERVTVLNQTPSAFYPLSERALAAGKPDWALRSVIFGGEALDPARLSAWCERFGDAEPALVNMYGITETTVHVTYRRLTRADLGRRSLIGRALPDLQLRVLDDGLNPLPAGVVGELYVGGAGLARGYLGRPDLTAERFVPDPWSRRGARLYRSGDLGRRLPGGEIEYIGRADHQVKVRGFRIELGEVEAQLRSLPGVRDAAVLAQPDAQGATQLVAYLVGQPGDPRGQAGLDTDSLRRQAHTVLPAYMVPAALVPLAELPVTINGKLDRKALLAAHAEAVGSRQAMSSPQAQPPRTELERQIESVWCELLGLERIGLHDDFFSLGGHSLLAARAIAKLRQATGAPLGMTDLFDHPSIAALSAHISRLPGAGTGAATLDAMAQLLDELEQESP